MYNLRESVEDYLKLEEDWLDALFKNYPKYRIHLALGATQKHFADLEGRLPEKRNYFKSKLVH